MVIADKGRAAPTMPFLVAFPVLPVRSTVDYEAALISRTLAEKLDGVGICGREVGRFAHRFAQTVTLRNVR